MTGNTDEASGLDPDLLAIFQLGYSAADQKAFLHIELAAELSHGTFRKIQSGTINIHINPDPVGGVQNFGKILGVTVLPPADTGFVRIIHASHVAALKRRTAVLLFKVSPLPHKSISDTENTF
ncbi:hypothetical protein D3C81_985720 [compost metagenome]